MADISKTAARALGQKQAVDFTQRLSKPRPCLRCNKQIETIGDLFPIKVMGKGMSQYCKQCRDSILK
jgi:hypothetical protein